jgi:aspartate racemase
VHIGLIGGIGPAATEFYYRGLVRAHNAVGKPMELTIVHAQVRDLVRNVANGAAEEQAAVFRGLVDRLAAAGAEAAAVTSMGGHFCINELEAIAPLPMNNAIPILDTEFGRRKLKRIGLLGNETVMRSRLYGGISSAEIVLPEGDDLLEAGNAYTAMALAGRATDEQRDYFRTMGQRLCDEQGADAIVLGGTDLFLAFDGQDCEYPLIDCAEIHIEALFKASIGEV